MSDTHATKAPQSTEEEVLRVSAASNPQNLASAIAHALYESHKVYVQAVGAGAVNQAVKAIAIARGFVAPRGLDLYMVPGFVTVPSKDGEISAMRFTVYTP